MTIKIVKEEMKYNIIALSIIALLVISALMFFNFKTGNVLIEYEETFNTGDNLSGTFTISIEPGDSINKKDRIFISLSRDDSIIETKTLSIEEFVKMSGKNPIPVEKASGSFYESPESYSVNMGNIMPYTFTESGKYELFLNVFELDIAVRKIITIN